VQLFKEALGQRGRVLACDVSSGASALIEADVRLTVPRVDEPDYADILLAVCQQHQVRLLFSLNDLELGPLSRQAPRLRAAGVLPVIAAPQVVETCLDKWLTFCFLKAAGVLTPETYLNLADARSALAGGALRFPVLIKPRWGSGSIGIEQVQDARELELAYEWCRISVGRTILARMPEHDPTNCLIIQERLEGPEYGMDVVNDLEGRHVGVLVRRKLAMRSGETDRAVSVRDARLEQLGKKLGQHLGHPGCLDCDVMVTERGCLVLDLNPRFGGGYPFSHLAGANIPAALVAWAAGEPADPAWFKCQPGVVAGKCDRLVIIDSTALGESDVA
jgi:carbamoyl-phosphate synthase large subunit